MSHDDDFHLKLFPTFEGFFSVKLAEVAYEISMFC